MIKKSLIGGVVALTLSGCAALPQQQTDAELITPAQRDYRLELNIAKLNELLNQEDLSEHQRLSFIYERGKIYDQLGLVTLARLDFMHALKLRPDFADVYNYLGIYQTLMQEYSLAFDSFDMVLALAPKYDYALLNRGIALYYASRHEIAAEDFELFWSIKPEDGFRSLWAYINEAKVQPKMAKQRLLQRKTQVLNSWEQALIAAIAGNISEQQLFVIAKKGLNQPNQLQQRACEAYFYLGQKAKIDGDLALAQKYFKKTLNTAVYDFVEYRYAQLELQQQDASSPSA
ncbi:lipoprotein NlpI [Paraferrimonas sp. SM1919]|uniref:lipoprotein NlpI n=1 Tax=Paraferrimonas sp. SM1919 TaxID=2662263 RepID=UPI0013D18EB8|nr:lipoprotein NlpI [Paraferrimonas sp. SM1919]